MTAQAVETETPAAEIRLRDLLRDTVHFGHQTRFGHPKMFPYIYGQHNQIHIINLEKTLPMFQAALNYLRHLAAHGGTILWVGTKRQARELIAAAAQRADMPYVNNRWLGGTLTNYRTLKHSIDKLKGMQAAVAAGALKQMSKKEALMFERQLAKLEKAMGGVQQMEALPEAMFVVDAGYHKIAIAEANKLGIPVVAVVDTNHSPEGVAYVIPGNDDARKAIRLYTQRVAEAIRAGRAQAIAQGSPGVQNQAAPANPAEFVELEEEA